MSGPYSYIGSPSYTSYTDTGLLSGTTYYYKVSAYSYYNSEGAESDYVSAETLYSPSSVPSQGSPLSPDVWTNGTASYGSVQYYYFYATSGSSYTIYWNDIDQGDGTKTGDIIVSAYWYSDDAAIFYPEYSSYSSEETFTATKTGYVILEVEPINSSGTFAIKYQ
jgi:hypothetical protein